MDVKVIRNEILNILRVRFGISITSCDGDNDDCNLLGHSIHLAPRDMLYLFFLLEERFSVVFDERDVDNDNFYFLHGLAEIINNKMETV